MRCLLTQKMIVLFGVLALSTSLLLQTATAQTDAESKAMLFVNLELGKGPEAVADGGICDEYLSFCGGDASCTCGCEDPDTAPLCIPTKGDRSETCSPFAVGFDDCRCACPNPSDTALGNFAADNEMLTAPEPQMKDYYEDGKTGGYMGICDGETTYCGGDASCKCGCGDDTESLAICVNTSGGESEACDPLLPGFDDCRCVCSSSDASKGDMDADVDTDADTGAEVDAALVGVSFGFQICNATQMCGGFADFQCDCGCESKEETATCIDDPSDNCDPLSGYYSDCSGVCVCKSNADSEGGEEQTEKGEQPEKGDSDNSAEESPLDAVDADENVNEGEMPDDQFFDIPTFDVCDATQACGGDAGFCGCGCDVGERATCKYITEDNCDPLSGAGCSGLCVCEEGGEPSKDGVCNKEFCGGSLDTLCDCDCPSDSDSGSQLVSQCVDDPNDLCNPLNGDRNCSGMCVCAEPATKPPLATSSPTASDNSLENSDEPTSSPTASESVGTALVGDSSAVTGTDADEAEITNSPTASESSPETSDEPTNSPTASESVGTDLEGNSSTVAGTVVIEAEITNSPTASESSPETNDEATSSPTASESVGTDLEGDSAALTGTIAIEAEITNSPTASETSPETSDEPTSSPTASESVGTDLEGDSAALTGTVVAEAEITNSPTASESSLETNDEPTSAPIASETQSPTASVTQAPTSEPTDTTTSTPTGEPTTSPVALTAAPIVPTRAPVADVSETDTSDRSSFISSSGWTEITYDDFENGWGSFERQAGTSDGSGAQMFHTLRHDVSNFYKLRLSFYVKFEGFEVGEGLIVEMQDLTNGGGDEPYVEIDSFVLGMPHENLYTEFDQFRAASVPLQNDQFYFAIVQLKTKNYGNPDEIKMRFRADVSGDSTQDEVYLDAILFQGK